MTKVFSSLLCGFSIVALSACGGSGSSDDAAMSLITDAEVRNFADASGDGTTVVDIGDVLEAGATLAAREVSEQSWRETFDGANEGYEVFDANVSIARDGDDLLITFDRQDAANPKVIRIPDAASLNEGNVRIENDDIFFDMFLGRDTKFADLFGDDAPDMLRFGIFTADRDDDFGIQTRSVFGVETRDDRLGTITGTGVYNGFGSIDIRRTDVSWQTFNGNVSGDMELVVDFGDSTITGSMTELESERRAGNDSMGEVEVEGQITFEEVTFTENAFAGDMTADADFMAADPEFAALMDAGTYSGAFYGENATDVGGTMRASATVGDTSFIAQGNFEAD